MQERYLPCYLPVACAYLLQYVDPDRGDQIQQLKIEIKTFFNNKINKIQDEFTIKEKKFLEVFFNKLS